MRRYQAEDYAEMAGWYEARAMPPPAPQTLSGYGLFAPGVAAGFLYRTDSALALIDGLATNPAASLRERSATVSALVLALCREAREQGFEVVVGLTRHDGVRRRVKRLGFRDVAQYAMMSRALS